MDRHDDELAPETVDQLPPDDPRLAADDSEGPDPDTLTGDELNDNDQLAGAVSSRLLEITEFEGEAA